MDNRTFGAFCVGMMYGMTIGAALVALALLLVSSIS